MRDMLIVLKIYNFSLMLGELIIERGRKKHFILVVQVVTSEDTESSFSSLGYRVSADSLCEVFSAEVDSVVVHRHLLSSLLKIDKEFVYNVIPFILE